VYFFIILYYVYDFYNKINNEVFYNQNSQAKMDSIPDWSPGAESTTARLDCALSSVLLVLLRGHTCHPLSCHQRFSTPTGRLELALRAQHVAAA